MFLVLRSPAELQFYTSLASLVIQLPTMAYMMDLSSFLQGFSSAYLCCCVLNGIFFHFQTISAYVLMDFISPVTHR